MANIFADRVKEATSTVGTGTLTLLGALSQFQSFVNGIGVGNTCDYCILSGDGINWETGNGTVGGSGPYSLSRDTVYASSNGGGLINLSGVSAVFCTLAAQRFANYKTGLFAGVMSSTPSQTSTGLTTWLNQISTSTVTNGGAGITLWAPSNGSSNKVSGLISTGVPTPPYSITAMFTSDRTSQVYVVFGWSDGTKMDTYTNSDGNAYHMTWTNASTLNTYASVTSVTSPYYFMKLVDDGTNISMSNSIDATTWTTIYTTAKSSGYLGATGYSQFVFGLNNYSVAGAATLMSWVQGVS